jgi:hypothetical protein
MKKVAFSTLLVAFGLVIAACVAAPVDSERVAQAEHTGEAAEAQAGCGKGIKACPASEVGQPCDPRNLSLICSAQASGAFCCLAVAP